MNQRNMGSMIAGSVLIVLGGLFLMNQFFNISIGRFIWPLFVLLPGVAMFVAVYNGGKEIAGLAIPASVVSMVGLILLGQSITDHWESWAYAWSLIFPTSIGLGMYIYGVRGEDDETKQRGRGMLRTGLILFVILAAFFEMIFAASGSIVSRVFWPVLIILMGLYLILRRGGLFSREAVSKPQKDTKIEVVPSVHGEEESTDET